MKKLTSAFIGFIKSPLSRISFGLVMLTVSLILIADFLGFMPDVRGNEISLRQQIAESSALQVSMEVGERSPAKMTQILQATVERNDRVLSAAVKQLDGTIVNSAGDHASLWTLGATDVSTVEQIHVALYTPKGEWGRFELVFKEMSVGASMFRGGAAVLKIVLYVALAGFIGYFFFLKKVMRELNPDQVLPDRVRTALDSLTDGLLVLNDNGVIMFCNLAMAKRIGINARNLTGKDCSSLDWVTTDEDAALPWASALKGEEEAEEQQISLRVGQHQNYQFIVNTAPIIGEGDEVRGALLTFNDVTELNRKNAQLEVANTSLEETQLEIKRQNNELRILATRDPLTSLFNRRAFFEAFDDLFEKAKQNKTRLACIMLDIDHFKSVNDTFGHGVGDIVIKYLADTLRQFEGDIDVVGRFGGEEFCMLIPDATAESAVARAEKIRAHIEASIDADFTVDLSITTSFGVSVLPGNASSSSELVEHADLALYDAKTSGRNKVNVYSGDKQSAESAPSAASADDTRATPSISEKQSAPVALETLPDNASDKTTSATNTAKISPARENVDMSKPGALVLVEQAQSLSHRQLLASNIEKAITRAKRKSRAMAVVVLDGASLQHISNNVDFNVGAKLCAVLVDRLKNKLNLTDVISQSDVDDVSGAVQQTEQHEIAILLSDIDDKKSIAGIIERLLEVFDQSIVIGGMEYVVDTHAGISILGDDGNDAETLLQNAYIACSNSKSSDEQNVYSFYSSSMEEAAKRRLRLQTDLYQSIAGNELEIYYQPKMDLVSGDLLGFEALLRWHHNDLGLISPVEFIPIAEKTGLIHKINQWVMTGVAEQVKRWLDSGFSFDAVAVNVSALELKQTGFAESVLNIIDQVGIPHSTLEIEITESIRIEELQVARRNLDQLHQKGMAISIDDFGTGYSSLGYLQHFPIKRLKIDRIFVNGCTHDEKKAKVVRSIITMGNSLGMRVLAEGVETQEQLLFLRDHHCDEMQGYFVSKPVPAAKTTSYLENPETLNQIVLAATMGSRSVGENVTTLPLSGLDAVISRFPNAGATAANEPDGQEEQDAQGAHGRG